MDDFEIIVKRFVRDEMVDWCAGFLIHRSKSASIYHLIKSVGYELKRIFAHCFEKCFWSVFIDKDNPYLRTDIGRTFITINNVFYLVMIVNDSNIGNRDYQEENGFFQFMSYICV